MDDPTRWALDRSRELLADTTRRWNALELQGHLLALVRAVEQAPQPMTCTVERGGVVEEWKLKRHADGMGLSVVGESVKPSDGLQRRAALVLAVHGVIDDCDWAESLPRRPDAKEGVVLAARSMLLHALEVEREAEEALEKGSAECDAEALRCLSVARQTIRLAALAMAVEP